VNATQVVAALSATAALVPDLKNPNFGAVAKAMGLWAHSISKAGELEESVQTWLANPVPAAACNGEPMQLVMSPSPFVSPEMVVGMAVYTDKAILHGDGGDVREMLVRGIP
jgi:pyruvate dehydrogenase (quinone)